MITGARGLCTAEVGVRFPSPPPPAGGSTQKRAAIGAATSPPAVPPSTSTATARSPRERDEPGMGVAADRRRRTRRCRSLPRRSRGSARERGCPVPPVTTARISSRSVPPRRGRGPDARFGSSASRRGARQRPSATVPATPAMSQRAGDESGPGRSSIAAPRGRRSRPAATLPSAAGTHELQPLPIPKSRAASGSATRRRRSASEMNAVLQDWAKSVRNGTSPAAPPSKLLNERAVDDLGRRARHGLVDRQPVAQQRRRGDHLEGRAGRVEAGQGAIERRVVRAVGDRQHVAGRRLQRDQRRLRARVAQRPLGGALDVEIERASRVFSRRRPAPAPQGLLRPRRPRRRGSTTERDSRPGELLVERAPAGPTGRPSSPAHQPATRSARPARRSPARRRRAAPGRSPCVGASGALAGAVEAPGTSCSSPAILS